MSESLKNKTVKGIGWSFIDNLASSGITFLVGLALARLLSPDEFGVLGMITIFLAVSNSIVDSGFSSALIRKNDVKEIDYNTVFYFNIFVGLTFYFILYFSSPAIGHFFKEPLLVSVTRWMGIILVINSLSIIQRTILVKTINFKTQTKISLIASVISGTIGVGMAFCACGVWSLVGQQISRQFLNTLFLWIYTKWHPAWEFSTKSFNELFGFGSKLLLSGLIDTIFNNLYYLVIGRFYSASQLGQYSRAEQFNSIFSINITTIIQRVSYPVLSSIQNEPERLKKAYRKVLKVTMLITFTCMLGLAASAKPLVLILIGEKWLESVSYLQIICFSGMLYPLHALNLSLLQVKGRSDLFLRLEIIKKTMAIIPIALGILYGIKFLLWGGVLMSFISYFINSYYSSKLIGYSTKKQIQDMLPTFSISIIVAAIMWLISKFDISIYIMLPLQCILGLSLAICIYEIIKLEEYQETKQMIFSLIKPNKNE